MRYTTRRRFLNQSVRSASALAIGIGAEQLTARDDNTNVELDLARRQVIAGKRQLFLDDVMLARTSGVTRTLHQPEKFKSNPIIKQGQTGWNEFRSQLYGTVLYFPEEGKFKMWYLSGARLPGREPITLDGRKRIPNFQLVGYAESKDGFEWTLPNLGLVNYNGSTNNNICRIARTNVEGIAVLHDAREPDPRRRYKALYWEHSAGDPEPAPGINGMSVSYSADGKSWTDEPDNPVMPYGSDTGQQLVWDETLEKYVAFGRFNAGGRKVARAESSDLARWSEPARVFDADSDDPPGTQIYGMGVSRYEGMYIGLPWMFHAASTNRIDVQLASSRDGQRWHRAGDRRVLMPNGPRGSWDAGIIFTAAQPIVVKDDRIFIYYSASEHAHDYGYLNNDPSKKGTPEWFQQLAKVGTSIGVATMRRDGFVSFDAGEATGVVETKTFVWPEKASLHVNVDAAGGRCLVDVLEGERSPIKLRAPLTADHLDAQVVSSKHSHTLPGREVRLRFRLNNASLYSWWLGP